LDQLRRWELFGGHWRICDRFRTHRAVALLTCDGGEEVDRLESDDPAKAAQPVGSLGDPGTPDGPARLWTPGGREQPINDLVEDLVLVADMPVQRHRRHPQLRRETAKSSTVRCKMGTCTQPLLSLPKEA
jgi:hypothetical protein